MGCTFVSAIGPGDYAFQCQEHCSLTGCSCCCLTMGKWSSAHRHRCHWRRFRLWHCHRRRRYSLPLHTHSPTHTHIYTILTWYNIALWRFRSRAHLQAFGRTTTTSTCVREPLSMVVIVCHISQESGSCILLSSFIGIVWWSAVLRVYALKLKLLWQLKLLNDFSVYFFSIFLCCCFFRSLLKPYRFMHANLPFGTVVVAAAVYELIRFFFAHSRCAHLFNHASSITHSYIHT